MERKIPEFNVSAILQTFHCSSSETGSRNDQTSPCDFIIPANGASALKR
jgi:hypothetical protein